MEQFGLFFIGVLIGLGICGFVNSLILSNKLDRESKKNQMLYNNCLNDWHKNAMEIGKCMNQIQRHEEVIQALNDKKDDDGKGNGDRKGKGKATQRKGGTVGTVVRGVEKP